MHTESEDDTLVLRNVTYLLKKNHRYILVLQNR